MGHGGTTNAYAVKPASNVLFPFWGSASATSASSAGTTANVYVQYMGIAPVASSSVTAVYSVVQAYIAGTGCEIGLYKGRFGIDANPTLVRLGSTNVAAIANSTGVKSTAITATVGPGDEIWFSWGSASTTTMLLRGMLADDLTTGFFCNASPASGLISVDPSYRVFVATSAIIPAWVTLVL